MFNPYQKIELSSDTIKTHEKAVQYLAGRDHSELELRTKLKRRFTEEAIAEVLEDLKTRGWILPPEQLAAKVAKQLGERGKGHRYINQYLKKKGLPEVRENSDLELEKAKKLVYSSSKSAPLDWTFEDRVKLTRRLGYRGYGMDTIRRALDEIVQHAKDEAND